MNCIKKSNDIGRKAVVSSGAVVTNLISAYKSGANSI